MNEKIRQQIDDLAYRLRCETKRTDLPEGIVRTYAEAYYAIGILQEECREAEDLRRRVKELKEGFEGCCTACEPVGEMNRQLRRERDEALREVCRDEAYRPSPSPPCTANQVADRRGWDCFKENTND